LYGNPYRIDGKEKFRKEHGLGTVTRVVMETPSKKSIIWYINAYEKKKINNNIFFKEIYHMISDPISNQLSPRV
jgi:hypothetical protein